MSASIGWELLEVAADLVRLEGLVAGTAMPLALHAFRSERGWMLIDTACVGSIEAAVLPLLARLAPGLPVEGAIVSHAHADHFGGNAELLRRAPGCTIYAHHHDLRWASDPDLHVREAYGAFPEELPCTDETRRFVRGLLGDRAPVAPVGDGDRFPLVGSDELEVVHLPGHSRGHLGVWQARSRTLVLSDALLGRGQRIASTVVGIPSYLDVAEYRGSIARVRALQPELLLPAHFPPLCGPEIASFLDASESFLSDLEGEIVTMLQQKTSLTLRQLTDAVVAKLAPEADRGMVAALSVDAHLRDLHQRGRCRVDTYAGVRRFELAGDSESRSQKARDGF